MKEKFKQGKGITLIALVITIIVLLILAGVSIAMLTGENGILTQAQNASKETGRASVIEQAQTDIMGKQAEEGTANLDRTDLKGILDTYFEGVPDNFSLDTTLQTKEKYGDYQIPLSDIYKGEIIDKPITSADIKGNGKDFYGSYVTNYTCDSNESIEDKQDTEKWQIFYADESHIYLIASDYITYESVPSSLAGNKPGEGYHGSSGNDYSSSVDFSNIKNDYKGSEDITDSNLQALNSKYFSYLNGSLSTNNNMKAVAYIMDTNVWNKFAGDYAQYAIGGPTIELLFASYNEKYSLGEQFLTKVESVAGYQISTDGGTNWSSTTYWAGENNLNTIDTTYVISNKSKANGMWIASPSSHYDKGNYDMYLDYQGEIGGVSNTNPAQGFRPLVCLKSDVQLKKTGDNTYEIIK